MLEYVQARQGPSAERGKWTQGPTPSHKDICNQYQLAKGKLVFSNRVSLDIITTIQGRTHAQEKLPNAKEIQKHFCVHFPFLYFGILLLC